MSALEWRWDAWYGPWTGMAVGFADRTWLLIRVSSVSGGPDIAMLLAEMALMYALLAGGMPAEALKSSNLAAESS